MHLTHPNLFDECDRLYMINHRISFYWILHYVSNIIWYCMGFFFYKYGNASSRDKKSYDIIFIIQYDIIIINLRIWHELIWYDAVFYQWHNIVSHDVIDTILYDLILHDTILYHMARFCIMKYIALYDMIWNCKYNTIR